MGEEAPPPASSNTGNPDPQIFIELVSTSQLFRKNQLLSPVTSPSEPRYAVKIRLFHRKPEVELHRGASTSGPVVGVVKLRIGSQDLGLGDPDRILEEGEAKEQTMVWEKLKKCNKWNYRDYEFEFGEGKSRKTYTWRRVESYPFGRLKTMELRIGCTRDTGGQLIALWRNVNKHVIRRGNFFIKREIDGVSEADRAKLEVMAILSMLAIVESAIRRQ